jgi:hypothetical protein
MRREIASSARMKADIRGRTKTRVGWVFEPDRQFELLKNFWGSWEKVAHLPLLQPRQPARWPEPHSAGRRPYLADRPAAFFGTKLPKFPTSTPSGPCITHDFGNQGFRLPYHEYPGRSRPEEHPVSRSGRGDAQLLLRRRTTWGRYGGWGTGTAGASVQAVKDEASPRRLGPISSA